MVFESPPACGRPVAVAAQSEAFAAVSACGGGATFSHRLSMWNRTSAAGAARSPVRIVVKRGFYWREGK
jgi:hypothetical protein